MVEQTIAFDNSRGHWKTRYSFISSCFMGLDKLFLSTPRSSTQNMDNGLIWLHNMPNSYNSFYDVDYSSALAVTFNGAQEQGSSKVSMNKIFKSFSIESTNNINASSSFQVSNATLGTPGESSYSVSPLTFRGGAYYGDIGQEIRISGSNIKAIGKISSVQPAEDVPGLLVDAFGNDVVINLSSTQTLLAFEIERFTSNNPIPSSTNVKLFRSFINSEGVSTAQQFRSISIDYSPLNAILGETYESNDNFNNPTIGYDQTLTYGDLLSSTDLSFKKGNYILVVASTADTGHVPYETMEGVDEFLFALTPGGVNGDDPKGQYADVSIALSAGPWEIYSLNVEFEHTDYDHSGASGRGKQ